MASTVHMNLTLPDPSVTIGPEWANQLNTAITTIDSHDHSDGKGDKITPAGMNMNADLDFSSNNITELLSAKFAANSTDIDGVSNALSVYNKDGDLYWTNASGSSVQITAGGAIASIPGSVTTLSRQAVSSNLVISAAATFVFLSVDTTADRTITLPSASTVADGRFFIIKDSSGLAPTNNITLTPDGADSIDNTASTLAITSANSTTWVMSDGVSNWEIF